MIQYSKIHTGIYEGSEEIPYETAHEIFSRLYRNYEFKFLLESKDISHIYGRLSLIGVDPILKISGKDENFEISVLQERGKSYLERISKDDLALCDHCERGENGITGRISKKTHEFDEAKRSQQKNIAQVIRMALQGLKLKRKSFLGLYGALSYDFIRLFEEIPNILPENDVNDFTFFLYDTFVFFDHLKEKTEIIAFRGDIQSAQKAISKICKQVKVKKKPSSYEISRVKFSLKQDEYEKMVEIAKEYTKKGELFEVVFSNILNAHFKGDPFALYLAYRETNPSPYLFYFDFGNEQLVGASPEMMVRVENNIAHLRPISGTARRGEDAIEDHENMLSLLSDPKEKAELDMLIDLGRNDLSRICKPNLKISDYRFVEKYSKVMHTVAHLQGELRSGYIALDALIACLNAGTLTGAPKVAAMKVIEKHEKERRGYYGGALGYFTFSGEMDTGIIIRTAHIRKNALRFQVGATLLHDSQPKKEYEETLQKAQAFLNTFVHQS